MKIIDIQADASQNGIPLPHHWDVCVGAGRANEGMRADWRRHLKHAADECGFRYLRFHGLFHDDMFISREEAGRIIYNFQYVDELFDFLLENRVRPFVEFGFCPGWLARETGTVFWWKGNGAPPTDFQKWGELVETTVRHWVARYGQEEVRKWYFEVWNEPNLHPFFRGAKSEYFHLYEVTATAVKRVDGKLRVGGPATSNFVPDERFDGETEDVSKQLTFQQEDLDALNWHGVWVEDFLKFCEERELPVDFVSAHPYPTDFALDGHGRNQGRSRGVNSTAADLAWIRRIVRNSRYSNAEIHLTEWSSSPTSRDFSHDQLPAACYIIKANLDAARLVDSLSYWVFTDVFEEQGAGDTPFHGGFGLLNLQDIPKPAFYAYRFLHRLGDEEIARSADAIITRESSSGRIAALLWNYVGTQTVPMCRTYEEASQIADAGETRKYEITLRNLQPGTVLVRETLTCDCAARLWGNRADAPSRRLTEKLRTASAPRTEFLTVPAEGTLILQGTLAPWECCLIAQEQ